MLSTGALSKLQDSVVQGFSYAERSSGYNTTQALKALPLFMPTLAQAKIRFMVLLLGGHGL